MSQFRLATLLKLRIDERDRRRLELAQAHEAERLLQAQSEGLSGQQDSLRALAEQAVQPGTANMETLLQINRHQAQLSIQQRTLDNQIRQVSVEAERRREALVEADRQVKVLEKLREKQEEQATTAELQREIKQFDEAALMNFRRQMEASS